MLKRLRRKIIFINMALVGVVLLCVFSALAVGSYQAARIELEQGLRLATEMGEGERFSPRIGARPIAGEERKSFLACVTVRTDADGRIVSVTENGASIDEGILSDVVAEALALEKRAGRLNAYALAYFYTPVPGGARLAFASAEGLSDALRESLFRSAALFAASLCGLYFVSLWLSGYAVTPIERAWLQQKRFVADASHELKTPLTVILANLNILASHPQDEIGRQRQWLESADEEAKHMRALIDQMLLLSKSEDEQALVSLSEINASDLIEEHLLYFESVAYEKGVSLRGDIEGDVLLRSDPVMLRQIAQILLDNAVKYSPPGEEALVTLKRRGDGAEIRVNNRGDTIPPEELSHVFDRFYRLDRARSEGGYGLGLAIAKSLCERLGGSISVSSGPEEGTTFRVTL